MMRLVEVDGAPAAVHTGGVELDVDASVTVVLLHGAGNDHSVWRFQTRRLAGMGIAVVAADLPGHGRSAGPALTDVESMARWLGALLDELGARRTVVVGHSMGSLIALQAAASDPGRVVAVGLVATADRMGVHPELLAAAEAQDPRAIDLIVGWSHTGPTRLGGHPQAGMWAPALTRRLLERHLPVLGTDLRAVGGFDAASLAEQVEVPALVVVGGRDRMTPARAGRAVGTAMGAEMHHVPTGGHAALYDDPDAVNAGLLPWIASVSSARAARPRPPGVSGVPAS